MSSNKEHRTKNAQKELCERGKLEAASSKARTLSSIIASMVKKNDRTYAMLLDALSPNFAAERDLARKHNLEESFDEAVKKYGEVVENLKQTIYVAMAEAMSEAEAILTSEYSAYETERQSITQKITEESRATNRTSKKDEKGKAKKETNIKKHKGYVPTTGFESITDKYTGKTGGANSGMMKITEYKGKRKLHNRTATKTCTRKTVANYFIEEQKTAKGQNSKAALS